MILAKHFSPPLEHLGTSFVLCSDGHDDPQACQGSHRAARLVPTYQMGMDLWSQEEGKAKKKKNNKIK